MSILCFVVSGLETVMLAEPEKESGSAFAAFARDAYFRLHHPKAILCTPLLRANACYGVLYLENDVNADAFTSSHVQLLQLLCSQAALSIDNARLYARLEHSHANLELLVKHRTAELVEKNVALQHAMELAETASKIKSDFLSNMSVQSSSTTAGEGTFAEAMTRHLCSRVCVVSGPTSFALR